MASLNVGRLGVHVSLGSGCGVDRLTGAMPSRLGVSRAALARTTARSGSSCRVIFRENARLTKIRSASSLTPASDSLQRTSQSDCASGPSTSWSTGMMGIVRSRSQPATGSIRSPHTTGRRRRIGTILIPGRSITQES